MAPRYAIYAAPAIDDPLWRFGSTMIGYDAANGADVASMPLARLDRGRWCALTEEPRRYGFHGTLKAPFELAAGAGEADLQKAIDSFAAVTVGLAPFALHVTSIGRFFTLTPIEPNSALQEFAGKVVTHFDGFRAPLTPEDRARRKPERLSERERAYLDTYGYPYVLETFRYHMTLTGQVPEELREAVGKDLRAAYGGLPPAPFAIDELVLFKQPTRADRFHILSRHALAGGAQRARRRSAQ